MSNKSNADIEIYNELCAIVGKSPIPLDKVASDDAMDVSSDENYKIVKNFIDEQNATVFSSDKTKKHETFMDKIVAYSRQKQNNNSKTATHEDPYIELQNIVEDYNSQNANVAFVNNRNSIEGIKNYYFEIGKLEQDAATIEESYTLSNYELSKLWWR